MKSLFAASFVFIGCASLAGYAVALEASIYQNDVETVLKNDGDAVELQQMPFSIRFVGAPFSSSERHTTLVAASTTADFFDGIEPSRPVSDVAFFSNGTKLSAPLRGYDFLMLSDKVHQELFYVPKQAPNPIKPLAERDGKYLFEWSINALRYNGSTVPMRQVNIPSVFIIIFADQNLNGIIDDSELLKAELAF